MNVAVDDDDLANEPAGLNFARGDGAIVVDTKAFAMIATDPTTRSPARILQPGPWWGDKPTAGGGTGGYGPTCRCGTTRARGAVHCRA